MEKFRGPRVKCGWVCCTYNSSFQDSVPGYCCYDGGDIHLIHHEVNDSDPATPNNLLDCEEFEWGKK
jgi:hypothetical protein